MSTSVASHARPTRGFDRDGNRRSVNGTFSASFDGLCLSQSPTSVLDDSSWGPVKLHRKTSFHLPAVDRTDELFSGHDCPITSPKAVPLRVVSYNIHGWRDTFHADNLARLTAAVAACDADVLILQEVLHPYAPPADPAEAAAYFQLVKEGKGNGFECEVGEGRKPYLDRLAEALGLPHVAFGKAIDDGYFGKFGYGNAVLSRFPIAREQHFHIKAHPQYKSQQRRIEAEDRCFSAVTLRLSDAKDLTFCVTHLDQLSDPLRVEQVKEILSHAHGLGPHVFAGDFNVFRRGDCTHEAWAKILVDADSKGWPHPPETSCAMNLLESNGYCDTFYLSDNHTTGAAADMGIKAEVSMDVEKPGATCWVIKPLLRIDYCFLSEDLRRQGCAVRQQQRLMDDCSDHFAIVIDMVAGEH
mmetsp:Transcript_38626/g.95057  ORF Transcript_38626/g.95057 Transcript_38626/m.95057 type:complete len:413 (-) Transcript_38626:349-1587(-)